MDKITTTEMEIALSLYFNRRTNLIVPNVSWGMFNHECDLIVLTPAGYAWEIEIKVDKYDLIKDKLKRHGHKDHRIKYLYFAIPQYLEKYIEHIPAHSGIVIVSESKWGYSKYMCRTIRKPSAIQKPYKFTDKDRYKIARLGALRIWTLKTNLINRIKDLNECRNSKIK